MSFGADASNPLEPTACFGPGTISLYDESSGIGAAYGVEFCPSPTGYPPCTNWVYANGAYYSGGWVCVVTPGNHWCI